MFPHIEEIRKNARDACSSGRLLKSEREELQTHMREQVREDTKRKILNIRKQKRSSEAARRRMQNVKEFHDSFKQVMSGATSFDELKRRLTLRNDFYQPCANYPEEELLDPRLAQHGATTGDSPVEEQKAAEQLRKRFSGISSVNNQSDQHFGESPPSFKFIVVDDHSATSRPSPSPIRTLGRNTNIPPSQTSYTPAGSNSQRTIPNCRAATRARTPVRTPYVPPWELRSAPPSTARRGSSRKLRRLNRIIENCRGFEVESCRYASRIGRGKEELERIFGKAEEHSRIVSESK